MKILHTADWHLGKRLDGFARHPEQEAVLAEICSIAEKEHVDAVIVAGDLFDAFNPPTESIDLLYKTFKKLAKDGSRPVIAIAGNHDSPDRIEAPDPLARECGIVFAGYPNTTVPTFELDTGLKITKSEGGFLEIRLPGKQGLLRLLLTPYANEFRLKTFLGHENSEEALRKVLQEKWSALAEKYCDDQGVNLLATHLFMVKKGEVLPDEPEEEKPILHVGGAQAIYTENIPKQIQYVALGHLHRQHTVDTQPCPVVYSGSPLSYSFSEANQEKYVMILEVENGLKAKAKTVPLTKGKRLLRKRAENPGEAIAWLKSNPNALVELTMATETYLTAAERKTLHNAHDGIVTIIPDFKNKKGLLNQDKTTIDLSRGIEELFVDYFKQTHGLDPDDRIMDLFKEVLSEEDEV